MPMPGDAPLLKLLIDMPRMADECRDMLRQALDVYVGHDVELARAMAVCVDVELFVRDEGLHIVRHYGSNTTDR